LLSTRQRALPRGCQRCSKPKGQPAHALSNCFPCVPSSSHLKTICLRPSLGKESVLRLQFNLLPATNESHMNLHFHHRCYIHTGSSIGGGGESESGGGGASSYVQVRYVHLSRPLRTLNTNWKMRSNHICRHRVLLGLHKSAYSLLRSLSLSIFLHLPRRLRMGDVKVPPTNFKGVRSGRG
jgi:hypothetical protein